MSRIPSGIAAAPSSDDFQSISSCGACSACQQIGVLVIHAKTRLEKHIQQYKSLGIAYFTEVAAVKSSWFDDDTNAPIADAFHNFPILEVRSSESQLDFITTLCMLQTAWRKYSDVYNLTEEAADGCRSRDLVRGPAIDDLTKATDELLEMVQRCDDSFIALEAAVGDIIDIAKRTNRGSAEPVAAPEILQDYESWKALVEALEG